MKRTQVQLDEATYAALRRRAYEEERSVSAVVRDLLSASLGVRAARGKPSLRDFTFIGIGRSRQGPLSPVSERHDEALAEGLAKKSGRR